MANQNAPFGLKPLTSATGAASNYEMRTARILYSDSTKIFRGDPVQMGSSGFIAQWTNGTAVSQLWGVFWGVEYLSTSQGKKTFSQFWPGADVASTAQDSIQALIIPCNQAVAGTFIVQSDATGITAADIGATADITLGTGNTLNGQSGAYLSNIGTAATLPFRIMGLYGGSLGSGGFGGVQPSTTNPYGGSATGAYAWAVVSANNTGSTGI